MIRFSNTALSKQGFTLIEMMVAVTIFSMIMLMSVGTILSIVDANRKAQTVKTAVNNLNFVIENMARNIRTGSSYRCGTGNLSGGSSIEQPQDCTIIQATTTRAWLAIEPYNGVRGNTSDQLIYIYNPADSSTGSRGRIERQVGSGSESQPLTSEAVVIERMNFFVVGARENSGIKSGIQPMVRLVVQGYAEAGEVRTNFNIQTTIAQRRLDI